MLPSEKYREEYDFVNQLLKCMIGLEIKDIPENKQSVITSCWDLYKLYIKTYFIRNYSKQDYIQLQAIGYGKKKNLDISHNNNVYDKYCQAHKAFIKTLSYQSIV